MVGKTLGHYEILEPLGAGGMGEVYRARDPSLKRDIAVKVLPEDFADDPDRLARLEREAHLLAALNHPNVATIHGLEEAGGVRFLVLELVEGETLAERLRGGALDVADALRIAQQIAEGLEAAHTNGMIHRDLKPANIKITPEGRVKVLDFGLAKSTGRAGAAGAEEAETDALTQSPTLTVAGTMAGVLLGTAPYMSPEHAKGKPVDKRTDIWAFGCVVFEMLTGRRPFTGEDISDTIASILKDQPDWSALPADTPPLARSLLRRCLRKDPNRRLHDIADARIEIEEALTAPPEAPPRSGDEGLVLRTFRLGDEVCRQLDRAHLDPRMIGSDLQYLDNRVPSDVLVVYLHGMGLDHRDLEANLRSSAHRSIAPTQVGFEPEAAHRFRLSLADHAIVTREFLRHVIERLRPATTILVGFSSGADLGFHILGDDEGRTLAIDGFLPLDCNISRKTCIFSRLVAEIPNADSPDLLDTLTSLAGQAGELSEWLNVNEYLVKVFRKFHRDVSALRDFAGDVVRPFEAGDPDVFPRWYRAVSSTVSCLRCVFSDTLMYHESLAEIRLANLDSGVLGEHYTDDSIFVEPGSDHFDLIDAKRLQQHIGRIVAAIR